MAICHAGPAVHVIRSCSWSSIPAKLRYCFLCYSFCYATEQSLCYHIVDLDLLDHSAITHHDAITRPQCNNSRLLHCGCTGGCYLFICTNYLSNHLATVFKLKLMMMMIYNLWNAIMIFNWLRQNWQLLCLPFSFPRFFICLLYDVLISNIQLATQHWLTLV